MLDVQHLRKSFDSVVAVDDVSFTLRKGELVGLLGPNGAGKTTTVSMIAGLVTPERGDVLIDGKRLAGDTDPAKRRIGLVPQDIALYEELSARENLRFFGSLYHLTGRARDRRRHAGRPPVACPFGGRQTGDTRVGVPHLDWSEPPRLMRLKPVLAMVRKDLLIFFGDRRSVILSFVVPIAIASFFGSIFSGSGSSDPARI